MKRLCYFAFGFALAMLMVGIAGRPAGAQAELRIVGALSNFDCFNDSQEDCEGFEIEIEGVHKEDVVHTWNYSAFGAPTVEDNGIPSAPRTIIRYHSGTIALHPGGVTHFGVTLRNFTQPGTILRRWLPKSTINVPNPPPVPYILPSHQSQVVVTNGVESVHNSITNDTPDGTTIVWVLPYGNKVRGRHVELDELMPNNPIVTNAVPMGSGSGHTRPARLDPGQTWVSDDEPDGGDDNESGVLWYDVFADVAIPRSNDRFDHEPGQHIGRVMDATLTTLPAPIPTALALSDTQVYGTQDVLGQVTISGGWLAPGGTVVTLTSDNPSAIVPTTVTVPVTQNYAQFVIHTQAVAALTNVTISVSSGNTTLSKSFAIKPPDLYQLWLAFASVGGGKNVGGAVYLTSPAPTDGAVVQLTSDSPVAEIPATVTVLAGATNVPFTVVTHAVTTPTTVTFTATYNGNTQTTTMRVVPNVATVSGTITLQGRVASVPTQNVTLTFRPTDGTPAFERVVTVGASASFSFTDIPANNYTLHVHSDRHLDTNLTVNAADSAVTGLSALLRAGDADNSNLVDVEDLSILIASFDADSTSPNWNGGLADFTGDGLVDVQDLALLIQNFDQAGDV